MGIFSIDICPICQNEIDFFTKSTIKNNGNYICQKCLKNMLNAKISISNIKTKPANELMAIINNYEDNRSIQKELSEKTKAEKEELKKEKIKEFQKTTNYYIEASKKKKQIKKVIIINNASDSRKKVGSTVIRGAVGGALLGGVGLIGGAMSGKNKVTSKTTFLIEYEDGHRETKVVDNNSAEYKKLCTYLNMN